jgi:hypothetical protein
MTRSKIIITILVFTILSVLATLPFTRLKGLMPGYHTFVYTPEKYEDVKTSVQSQNKKDLAYIIDKKLLPYWLGTTWNFNGTTQVPGEGSIACGYFVTTLLRDAGVKLERVKLAQMASEKTRLWFVCCRIRLAYWLCTLR